MARSRKAARPAGAWGRLQQTDRVVGPHVDGGHLHERTQANRGALVVRRSGTYRRTRGSACSSQYRSRLPPPRAHRRTEVQHTTVRRTVPHIGGALSRNEGLRVIDRGVVGLPQVSGAAPQLGERVGNGVDDLTGGLTRGNVLARPRTWGRQRRSSPGNSSSRMRSYRAALSGWPRATWRRTSPTRRALPCRVRLRSARARRSREPITKDSVVSKPRISLTAATSSSPRGRGSRRCSASWGRASQ